MLSKEGWERIISNCLVVHMMNTMIMTIIMANYKPGTNLNALFKSIHLTQTIKTSTSLLKRKLREQKS